MSQSDAGPSSLFAALDRGNIEAVRTLTALNANVNEVFSDQRTPLHLACQNNFADAVQLLLQNKADIDARDSKLQTPLHCAARAGNATIVRSLLSAGSDVDAKNSSGRTPSDVASGPEIKALVSITALYDACNATEAPSLELLQELLAYPALRDARIKYRDQNSEKTPLHNAAYKGFTAAVRVLLDARADVDARKKYLQTPLHLAASSGFLETMRALLDARAHTDARDHEDQTPLHRAAAKGHVDAVKVLLSVGSNIEAKGSKGETPAGVASHPEIKALFSPKAVFEVCALGSAPSAELLRELLAYPSTRSARVTYTDEFQAATSLHLASGKGYVEAVQALINSDADVEAKNIHLQRPLHLACEQGHIDAIKVLLSAGADVEAKDCHHKTPLHMASIQGHTEALILLLDAGAVIEAKDSDDRTPLHHASINGHAAVVVALLDKGANVTAAGKDLGTPLHSAAFKGNADIVKALLARGADVDARDGRQRSPLHLACAKGHVDDITILLDANADIEAQNERLQRSVHFAAENGRSGALQVLLDAGAAIEAKDADRRTALHAASMKGHADAAKLLIDRGAAIEANDNHLSTPLHLASARGHSSTVKKLIEAGADMYAEDAGGRTPVQTAVSAVISIFESAPSSSVLKLRGLLKSRTITTDLSALPSPSSIASAIQNFNARDVGRHESLSIARSHLKSGGVSAIAASLPRLSSLTSIDMSDNPELGDSGVACLLKSLPATVISLSIGKTGLKDISQELIDCFCKFTSLTSLDISENAGLSNSDMRFLLQTLPTSLKSLSMCNLRLNSERVRSVEDMLSRLNGLENLNLSHNEDPRDSGSFDSVVDICCRCFPSLQTLDLSYVPTLYNVPPMVSCLHNLHTIIVTGCENLASLPDELEDMASLTRIDIDKQCKNLDFPPLRIALEGGVRGIKDYLHKAKRAKPLKKCKVVFLGNGRSGKTSLLRALASLPMNPHEASTQGISASHDFSDKLQPGVMSKFGGAPELYFWDFAGQLEYSAAHEFFMSNRQAVYVVIFSAVDDHEAQVHQVTYWLRTVLTRDLSCVRVVMVGTKIDLIEPQNLVQELRDIEGLMQRAFNSVIQKVAPSCRWSASVKFVTSKPTHAEYKKRRSNLKEHIFELSTNIFKGRDRMLRFPQEYSDMLSDVKKVRKRLSASHRPPILKLSDQSIVTSDYKNLCGAHNHSMKLEALKILGDVGELIYYEVDGSPWICVEPQLIASAIALFADPGRRIKVTSSRDDIYSQLSRLDGITHDAATHQKLFDFLLALKVVIRASELVVSPSAARDELYLVPLAFKGRPGFWSEIVDVKGVRAIRGVRFTAQRMISVASFVRAMSSMCSQPQHMWGCAFFSKVTDSDAVSVFVRLAESRCAVDMVVLGPPGELSSEVVEKCLKSIAAQLGCGSRSLTFLCPQCCQSDAFLRSGNAHAFYLETESSSSRPPVLTLLSCSRYHAPSVDGVKNGVPVTMSGTHEIVLTDDALRSKLPWAEVVTGAGILKGITLLPTQRKTSGGDIVVSFPSASGYHPHHSASSSYASATGVSAVRPLEATFDDSLQATATLRFRGTVLPNSFFVLTKQLHVDDVLEDESLQRLLIMLARGGSPEQTVPVRVLRKNGSSIVILEQVLKVVFSVADSICHVANGVQTTKEIETILSLSRKSEICDAEHEGVGILFVRTSSLHHLQFGALALICLSANDGGGLLCRVVDVVSPFEVKLAQANNPDDAPPKTCLGASILPCQPSFGPNDNVLVIYTQTGPKPDFDLFAGRSDGLELAQLTPADCSGNSAVAACWRDVENHWEVMLGTEFKNYEITRITMFRNRSREDLFFRELRDLKASAASRPSETDFSVASDSTPGEKEKRLQLQAQTMGHFKEFADKFSLLPKSESKDVNLSVAWWGKWPSAYFTNAQHGFFNLPPHLKLDPGFFGEGFYLTQYPRYSDYYISGCSLSSRNIQQGAILLCYAALGRPYPVTQNPYAPGSRNMVPPSSLCGKRCGAQCGGANSHDCHYATVKKDSDSSDYFPCPLRQQPDFDEIVMFKSERILPVAFVSFQRRRKTLLWLDDWPDKEDNLRIRGKIPGAQFFDEMEGTEQRTVTVTRADSAGGGACVRISGASGHYASVVNGVYAPTSETCCRRPVYRKQDVEDDADVMWIEYDDARQQWQVKDTAHRGNGGCALASIVTLDTLEQCGISGYWKVVTAPPKAGRVSFKLNSSATDPRRTSSPLNRESQVDLTLFTSVAALVAFLSDAKQAKFAKYPPSLFRIICNRRMFLGSVPVSSCDQREFLCPGISALLSVGDEVMFEGERLFGGVEAGVTYYLVAIRRGLNREFFSVSKEKDGNIIELQPQPLQKPPRPPMIVRASQRSLLHFLEVSDAWHLSFPATCVFHGGGSDGSRALPVQRPNFVATSEEADCDSFVAFEPMTALHERS